MKNIRIVFFLLCTLTLSACSQIGIFTANIPYHFSKITNHEDILFSKSHALKLDIYTPAKTTHNDVVVFFYGGRWTDGSKEQYKFLGTALADQGFIVVIPDYRKYPDVKFPAFAEDAAEAVAWTHDHISSYGGNPDKINLSGHSSGAHLAALVATNPEYLAAFNGKGLDLIHSFVGLAGPYDFTPEEEDLKDMFGPPENYPAMRPAAYASKSTPPSLLLHGADDTIVGKFNYKNFQEKILKEGGCAKSKLYKGIDHVWIVGSLSWLGAGTAPILKDMVDFFKNPKC